jgi:hypothetical protein
VCNCLGDRSSNNVVGIDTSVCAWLSHPEERFTQTQAIDRRERLRRLALETIDLAKDPYFMRNHLGQYECRLCLTLHNNEGNYLAHTQVHIYDMNSEIAVQTAPHAMLALQCWSCCRVRGTFRAADGRRAAVVLLRFHQEFASAEAAAGSAVFWPRAQPERTPRLTAACAQC